ncbi:MAG: hypothetical protein ABIX01_05840 [Chitinophagaceae bacterium]
MQTKRFFLYLLFFSYTMVLIKPVLPIVSDCIAHTFWKLEHISTTHFENGKYHVHFELLHDARENKPNRSAANTKIEVFAAPHIIAQQAGYHFYTSARVSVDYPLPVIYYPSIFLEGDFLPPKACPLCG